MSPIQLLHDQIPHAIAAITIVASKRGLLDASGAKSIANRLVQMGATGIATVRSQLEQEALRDVSMRELIRLLPPSDDLELGSCHLLAQLANAGMHNTWLGENPTGDLVVIKTIKEATGAMPGSIHEDDDGSLWLDPSDPSSSSPPAAQPTPPMTDSRIEPLSKRFAREARIHAALAHPQVVRVLDHGVAADGTLFLVMEYLPGGDLRDLVNRRGPLDETAALRLAIQMVDGLAAGHAAGLKHHLKPGNVFITAEGDAKLADFRCGLGSAFQRMVGAGQVAGFTAYRAPELIDGGDDAGDFISDVYSFGGVLFYLLAGRPPYLGTEPEIAHQHRIAAPPDVRSFAPQVRSHCRDHHALPGQASG